MIDELLNEIKELQEYKKKYLYAEKDKQRMSDLLYEYMIKEYNSMPNQERISKHKKEYCNHCRNRDYCAGDFPEDVYKPVQSDKAWIPGRVTCGKFR